MDSSIFKCPTIPSWRQSKSESRASEKVTEKICEKKKSVEDKGASSQKRKVDSNENINTSFMDIANQSFSMKKAPLECGFGE